MTAVARILSAVFGLLMVVAAGGGSHGHAFAAAALAAIAVAIGTVFRPAATLAVLLAVSAMVLADPAPGLAALAGLCAAAYLVLRFAVAGAVTASRATIVAALGFTLVGLVAAVFPLRLPWLPLVAPLAVFAVYALVTRPFWPDTSRRS